MKCRFCNSRKLVNFLTYTNLPISNKLIKKSEIPLTKKYTLKILFCKNCWLVQTKDTVHFKKIFNKNYLYHSSYSKDWLSHCKKLSKEILKKYYFKDKEHICEIASNDGYLLKNFKNKIGYFGVEPSSSVAKISIKRGIKTFINFFSYSLSKKLKKIYNVKLIIALNVIAHVPNINDVLKGISNLLNNDGVVIFEFPYLKNLIEKTQFDTIYHEHFSYFTFSSFNRILNANELKIYDVKKVPTHGGSLRVYAVKKSFKTKIKQSVFKIKNEESKLKINSVKFYKDFEIQINQNKLRLEKIINKVVRENKTLYGYGAASKSTVLVNVFKINSKVLRGIFDKNKYKVNRLIPGANIPIIHNKLIKQLKPDYIIIFPWNLNEEILYQLKFTKKWGCKFIIYKNNKYITI